MGERKEGVVGKVGVRGKKSGVRGYEGGSGEEEGRSGGKKVGVGGGGGLEHGLLPVAREPDTLEETDFVVMRLSVTRCRDSLSSSSNSLCRFSVFIDARFTSMHNLLISTN